MVVVLSDAMASTVVRAGGHAGQVELGRRRSCCLQLDLLSVTTVLFGPSSWKVVPLSNLEPSISIVAGPVPTWPGSTDWTANGTSAAVMA